MTRLREWMFRPVDAASLAVFRVSFGLIMLWEVSRYFGKGWIEKNYVKPQWFFKYYGFEWIQPWPGDGMYWHFAILGVLAALVTVGLFYRFAAIGLFLAFTYIFLIDQNQYKNHFYFASLLAFLMAVAPAHRGYSLDAWLWPRLREATVPNWSVWSIRAQFEVMLLYAGIVKVNADWLRLEPMRMWMAAQPDFPLLGAYFAETWVVALAAYGAIALHLIGAPLLLFRKTRGWVFVSYVFFHGMNAAFFEIGIFPWLTLFGTLIFFDPDWPKQVWQRLRGLPERVAAVAVAPPVSRAHFGVVAGFLALWFAAQVLVPLRHYAYPGDVAWNEEGHRFAWRMKLRQKRVTEAVFEVTDPATNRRWQVDITKYKMRMHPDMILQWAYKLEQLWQDLEGVEDPEVRARVMISLNGRLPALLVDPNRDLTKIERNLWHADWILPLDQPFLPHDQRPDWLPQ